MNNSNITIQERSKRLASIIIKTYAEINEKNNFNSASVVLLKQFLRSDTSVESNCGKVVYAQFNKDFLSKYLIVLKKASETKYWIELMIKNQFSDMLTEVQIIIKILVAITKKLKEK